MAERDVLGILSDHELVAMSATAEEPDVSAQVRQAQDQLTHAIAKAGLTNDPFRHLFEALSSHIGAMHALYVAGQTTDFQRLEKSLGEALERRMDRAGRVIADRCMVRLDRRATRLVVALFAVVALGAGVLGGVIDHYLIGQSAWRAPAACWAEGGKTLCQPGVWLGERR